MCGTLLIMRLHLPQRARHGSRFQRQELCSMSGWGWHCARLAETLCHMVHRGSVTLGLPPIL